MGKIVMIDYGGGSCTVEAVVSQFYQKFGPEYNILRRREWKIKYFIFFSPGQIRSCLRAMRLRNDDIEGDCF